MNYYHLACSLNQGEAYIEREQTREGLSLDLNSGQPLRFTPGDLELYHHRKEKKLTDLLAVGSYLVVSPKMKEVLEQFDADYLEFFEVPVFTTWNKKQHLYYLVNVLDPLDCTDLEVSSFDFDWDGERLDEVRRWIVKEERIGTRQVFKDRRIYGEVFVGEAAKQALEAAKLTGMRLVPSHAYKKGFAASSVKREYLLDCRQVQTEAEFWQLYLDVTYPNLAEKFERTLEAFEQAITGEKLPGYPGQCDIRIVNTAHLRHTPFYQKLQQIAEYANRFNFRNIRVLLEG
ncbi:MAG: hypothetical protein SFU83_12260 [Meiothermus sp.]|nr:hypothetical protein [Meiothermus sp.]